MKRILSILLLLALCLALSGCGGSPREVQTVATLVEQEYSLAFRTGDPTAYYVVAAIEELKPWISWIPPPGGTSLSAWT